MGVPGLFNWLIEKYPKIMEQLSKENKFECDYFYLDMNGIIHPCCHPPTKAQPQNEEEMILWMGQYLDMLLDFIHPKQLLFIAVDGSAPRAKMMQQRERRFIKDLESQKNIYTQNAWDSNKISPGTKFMSEMSKGLSKYIQDKLRRNHQFKNLKIILSDSSVPGEGEHKILDFIRNKRYRGDYNVGDSHLLFSNDADMIFLSLLLHESNIYLMRDIPLRNKSKRETTSIFQTRFNLLHIAKLRKYIGFDLSSDKLKYDKTKIEYDIDRIIDDFVFFSYLMGNDFIPCIPFMNVRDGAYQYLVETYIEIAPKLSTYLVDGGSINNDSFYIYLNKLAQNEADILKYRYLGYSADLIVENKIKQLPNHKQKANEKLNVSYREHDGITVRSMNDAIFIKFGQNGWKCRYYQRKFNDDSNKLIKDVSFEYFRAISWIQQYYYSGVASWNWFYPHHYAPTFTDLALCCKERSVEWNLSERGQPLEPLSLLALIMPKFSAKRTLPKIYFDAIFGKDSKLKKYYPESFEMDLNFKSMSWEAIALLNPVNFDELEAEFKKQRNLLDAEYKKLDSFGCDKLFYSKAKKVTISEPLQREILKLNDENQMKADPNLLFEAWSNRNNEMDQMYEPVIDLNIGSKHRDDGCAHYKAVSKQFIFVCCHFESQSLTDAHLILLAPKLKNLLFDLYGQYKRESDDLFADENKGVILLQLYLSDNCIESHGLSVLLNVISSPIVFVECLSLSNNPINEKGALFISDYLRDCENLPHRIDLCQTEIGNKGMSAIINGMIVRKQDENNKQMAISLNTMQDKLKKVDRNCGVDVPQNSKDVKLFVPVCITVDKSINVKNLSEKETKDINISTNTGDRTKEMDMSKLPFIDLFIKETVEKKVKKLNVSSDSKMVCKEWGLKMLNNVDDSKANYCIDIQIPHTFNICSKHRKCEKMKQQNDEQKQTKKENELKINGEELKIVNEVMFKYFVSGKKVPNGIVRYMKKKPDLMKRSLKQMKDSTEWGIENRVKGYAKKQRMKEQMEKNNINDQIETINILNMDKNKSNMTPKLLLTNKKNECYMLSDDDAELLILVGFKKCVDLKAIKIRATMKKMDAEKFADVSAPKLVFVYAIKDLNVNFNDLEDMQSDKDITTGLNKVEKGQMIKLQNEPKNMAKFKKLKCLAIYIQTNHKDTEKTLIHSISLIQNFEDEKKKSDEKPKKSTTKKAAAKKKSEVEKENKFDVLSVDESD